MFEEPPVRKLSDASRSTSANPSSSSRVVSGPSSAFPIWFGPAVRVNTVCPGFIQTRWLLGALGQENYEKLRDAGLLLVVASVLVLLSLLWWS